MLNKTVVYDFIKKVEQKALETLQKNYDEELKKAIEDELDKSENAILKEAIQSLQYHIDSAIAAQNTVTKYLPYQNFVNSADVKKWLFRSRWNFPKEFNDIRAVHAEHEDKVRNTREEYDKIKSLVKRKRNGDQAKTALIALGFDVSYLDKLSNLPVVIKESDLKINKNYLFSCKENGI